MPQDKKILLTGFKPFKSHQNNPSEILVQSLSLYFGDQSNIETMILPTEYEGSWRDIETKLDDFRPDIVLSFGLAARRKHICLESTGYNKASISSADMTGYIPQNITLIDGAPSFYKSRLPLKKLETTLRHRGHNIRVSRDAGDYVCNATLYKLLHHAKINALDMKATFVHLPKPRRNGLITEASLEMAAIDLLENI